MGAADAKSEGEKKPAADAGADKKPAADAGGEKKDDAKVISVYKIDMHCEGCAKKFRSAVKRLEGVEAVKTDCEGNKLTVTGKVDPAKVKARLEEKTKKKVDIISPLPKKDGGGEKKPEEKKPEEKKPEEKKPPKESTVVLKIRTHCDGCVSKMKKIIVKIKGVDSVSVDAPKDLLTVKGTMDVNTMVPYLNAKLKRTVEVVPPKKDEPKKEGGGGGGEAKTEKKEGGGEAKGEKKEGDGGKKDAPAPAAEPPKMEVSKLEYFPAPAPTHWLDGVFGHSYSAEPHHQQGYYPVNHQAYNPVMNHGSYGYVQQGYVQQGYVMEPMYNHPMHAPQMFSEENPNACSIM
ncbi:heavy metal-associated isoprenylated plant protein 5 [Ricinus communis]|uniref:Metal ion binding protein, putative n=1 Tax=Ricinus communis TaxID=3988 RepID=B9S0H4_RICCO|nr:heavy metal-associated isoprenylated plant protein 5 [Ricinus communis]EEF42907.1 metal ion binding protein, putative [Ricinus communis]|eukprot:XP_002519493.1 heavy metal-associated isoprenylated plant protein 5 [Ricinus communis]